MSIDDPTRKLFSEFPPVSTREWEDKILADLKGADYNRKLIWKTDEGFEVKPYYRAEDLTGLEYLQSIAPPDDMQRRNGMGWWIRQDITACDIEEANRVAVDAVGKGADSVGFNAAEVTNHQQMRRLLENIDLTKTCINFTSSRSYPLTLELFYYEVNHRNCDPSGIKGSLNFDLISYLLLNGDFYISLDNNLEEAEYLLRTIDKKIPGLKGITVNGHYFREAGSTLVQELAFSLASAAEYMHGLTSRGLPAKMVSKGILFSLGTGSDYFLEIAKHRAARILWNKIIGQYIPEVSDRPEMFIHSKTILRNQSIYDPYVNMLRSVTEGMAAATGNADSVSITAFNCAFRNTDPFASRIARNQQLILREEAYLDKVHDPSSGSYFIENLTHSFVKNAWDLFLKVEEKGGLIECIKTGYIQEEVAASARKREEGFASRRSVLIGINQYPNLTESIPAESVPVAAFSTDAPPKYPKMVLSRDSLSFEILRGETDKYVLSGNKRPVVYLLTVGNVIMRKARAAFTTNFFGCAGYSIVEEPHISDPEEGVEAALKAGANIVVICSSDEEYAGLAPQAAAALKAVNPGILVVVAGYPKEIVEMLTRAGIDDFIHVRSNLLETLVKYQKLLGIIK